MNITAFTEKPSIQTRISVAYERFKLYNKTGGWAIFNTVVVGISLSIFFGFALLLFLYSLFSYMYNAEDAPLVAVLLFLLLVVVYIGLIAYVVLSLGKHIAIMQKFAHDNNWQFHSWVKVADSQGLAFAVQNRKFARNGVAGNIFGKTFWLYEYRFITGGGRSQYPNIFTVFLIHLKYDYPQTVFINKKGRLKIIWSKPGLNKIADSPYGTKALKLYSTDGKLSSAVSKLLPDQKIQSLLAINKKIEIEIKNNSLRIFLPGKPIPTKDELEQLISFLKHLDIS